MLKIRRLFDRLIFNMWIPIPGKNIFTLRLGPVLFFIMRVSAVLVIIIFEVITTGLNIIYWCMISKWVTQWICYNVSELGQNWSGIWHNWSTIWAPSQYKGMGTPMLKIRRSRDRLILNMGIPILVRWHIYIEMGPCLKLPWCDIICPESGRFLAASVQFRPDSVTLWHVCMELVWRDKFIRCQPNPVLICSMKMKS